MENGSKQVELVGAEEKQAFTIMASVANDRNLLLFQAIYQGLTPQTEPGQSAPGYADCKAAGFRFEHSGTSTYWSNLKMMQNFVTHILVPYFDCAKAIAGRPLSQKSIWQIDIWSVHRSLEFCTWMKDHHPDIILDYVPGGCTGVFQPCNVGIQCPFKLLIKKTYHNDVIEEILAQEGKRVITINKEVGVLRDRSVCWLWNAFSIVNHPELVKKV
jgi:hypothetical protein